MDLFEEEIVRFFKILCKNDVRFILVGGIAVNYHGFSRSTADIGVWLEDDKMNRSNLVSALNEYGVEGAAVFSETPFLAGYTEVVLENGMHIDLMSELQFFKKENFKENYIKAHEFNLADEVQLKMLHINTLIEEKEKSDRPKDKLDADTLKKLYHA